MDKKYNPLSTHDESVITKYIISKKVIHPTH